MTEQNWYIRLGEEIVGPLSETELTNLARRGALEAATGVSSDGASWKLAPEIKSLATFLQTPASEAPGQLVPNSATALGWVGPVLAGLGILTTVLVVLLVLAGLNSSRPPEQSDNPGLWNSRQGKSAAEFPTGSQVGSSPSPAVSGPRLNVKWTDATPELLPLVQHLTPGEQAELGLSALATGMDIYAARVFLQNAGNVPLRVFPQNLRIHFGNETAMVYTLDDQRFLSPVILNSGESTSGLVTFTARIDIGAEIRSGAGAMSYVDPTIRVTYE